MMIARRENDLTSSYITKDGLRHLLNNQGPSDILEAAREILVIYPPEMDRLNANREVSAI